MNNEVTITREKLVELKASCDILEEFDEFVPSGSISWNDMFELIRGGKICYDVWFVKNLKFSGMFEYADGSRYWYLNGKLHRENGPAIEVEYDGRLHREWWLNDKRHREDGPSIEWAIGARAYHLNGVMLSEEQFNAFNAQRKATDLVQPTAACPDCKGTGVYVGLLSREVCRACGGRTQK